MDSLEGIAGGVTAVTGFDKGSGKTTFLGLALPLARRAGPVAAFTIGLDGAQKAGPGGAPAAEVQVEPGDLVLTTEALARAATARFEVLEALPGRTALGRLLLGRAVRAGSVTLVGPEHFTTLAEAVARVRQEGWAASVLVDGAVSRITQVSALGEVRFVYTARVDPGNLARTALRLKALAALASLPLEPSPEGARLEGPLTADTLGALPKGTEALSLEDFTKVFLEPEALLRTLGRIRLSVRRRFDLLACVVALREVGRPAFLEAVGPEASPTILFSPLEEAC